MRLVRCVLAAVPLWFAIGIVVSFSPEIRGGGNVVLNVAAIALSYSFGETSGEVISGILSQLLRSRKKAMLLFATGALISAFLVFSCPIQYYGLLCMPLGFFVGYWSVLITSTAEQFGTNLPSTATTLVPNLVRASNIPITLLFSSISSVYGPITGAMLTGGVCFAGAFISILMMDETFAKDLDFVEA